MMYLTPIEYSLSLNNEIDEPPYPEDHVGADKEPYFGARHVTVARYPGKKRQFDSLSPDDEISGLIINYRGRLDAKGRG